MTKDEALKLALEALETCNWVDDGGYGHAEYDHVSTNKAITAIREALASSVATNDTSQERVDETSKQRHDQEPIGWTSRDYVTGDVKVLWGRQPPLGPLYTTPPQRKPLTDEQWQVIADTLDCLITRKQKDAIEAVIGIKE